MAWWGKIVGGAVGYALGGPLGAFLGAALGYRFDQARGGALPEFDCGERERTQAAFFTATFSVMGHLCKADGRVSQDEIELARAVMAQMALSDEQRRLAMRLFHEGKRPDFPLADTLAQLRRECHYRQTLLRMFVEIELAAALADGVLHPQEDRIMRQVCDALDIGRQEYGHLLAMLQAHKAQEEAARRPARAAGLSLDDAYAILGVKPTAGSAEVKRAYRRLLSQHHPDKLLAKGLPEEMMKVATQKTQEIRRAYERVQEARGDL